MPTHDPSPRHTLLFYCCGDNCPGYPWKASERAHPASCASGQECPVRPLPEDPPPWQDPETGHGAAPGVVA